MAITKALISATLAASLLAGCSTIKQATGQIDNTKLPGQREDILPPDQQQARDPAITGQPLPQDPSAQRVATTPGAAMPPQQPMAPGAAQQPNAQAYPGPMPQTGAPAAPGAMKAGVPIVPAAPMVAKGQETIGAAPAKPGVDCDPKVDLCPEVVKPEPLPPPSPLIPEKKVAKAGDKAAAAKADPKAKDKAKKPAKKLVKKKKPAEDAVPPEPKLDVPPPPGPADAPKPQSQ
jgi:hypothetical protein